MRSAPSVLAAFAALALIAGPAAAQSPSPAAPATPCCGVKAALEPTVDPAP